MLKAKGWKREWPANSKEQKAGVSTLISNKVGFHTKCIIKDEWYHVMMMKDSTHQEDRVILNLDALRKSVMFSLPSVSPLEFSFPSARDFRHAPCSSFSTQQPVWPSHCSDGSSYNTPIPECGASVWCGLICSVPALPTSAPSQPLHHHLLWSVVLWMRYCLCLVWSALSYSFGWLKCTLLRQPSLPSLFWTGAFPLLALRRHLVYFIALFHTLSSSPLYLPAYLSKV